MNHHFTFNPIKPLGESSSFLPETSPQSTKNCPNDHLKNPIPKKSFISVLTPKPIEFSSHYHRVDVLGPKPKEIVMAMPKKEKKKSCSMCGCLNYLKGEEIVDFGFSQNRRRVNFAE